MVGLTALCNTLNIFIIMYLNVDISAMFFCFVVVLNPFPPACLAYRPLLKPQRFVIWCNHDAHPVPINQRDPQLMTPDFLQSVHILHEFVLQSQNTELLFSRVL